MHKISIITVNFNNLSGLKKTIQSVKKQSYTNYEYIIIDGGSTDGSKEYIETEQDIISYWVSEKDNGIYDGMNKGITHATGEYLLFLNSGDYFVSSDTLFKVFNSHNYIEDLIIGRQYYINNKGRISTCHKIKKEDLNDTYFWSNTLPHQATFIKKDLFFQIGKYEQNYKIIADWVFWYKSIIKGHASYKISNTFISYMEQEGISSNIQNCRNEMIYFLLKEKNQLNYNDWTNIINIAHDAYTYKRLTRNKISKFLSKIILYLNKGF